MKKYILIFVVLFYSCIPHKEKSTVICTGKQYVDPRQSHSEVNSPFAVHIKRINGTSFLWGFKEMIVYVDHAAYDTLQIGDTLKENY